MKNKSLRKLTAAAMLTAVAIILGAFAFPIFPQVSFLEYDAGDVAVLVSSFAFGPQYGIASSFIVALIQGFLLDKSGAFGFLMNVISTTALILPASLIYLKKKTKKGAVIALFAGSLTMLAVMILFNYIVTPYFMGVGVSAVNSLMPFIILFNIIKTVLNSVVTFLLYKHIGKVIKKFS